MFDEIKLLIYESSYYELITESEKDYLLAFLEETEWQKKRVGKWSGKDHVTDIRTKNHNKQINDITNNLPGMNPVHYNGYYDSINGAMDAGKEMKDAYDNVKGRIQKKAQKITQNEKFKKVRKALDKSRPPKPDISPNDIYDDKGNVDLAKLEKLKNSKYTRQLKRDITKKAYGYDVVVSGTAITVAAAFAAINHLVDKHKLKNGKLDICTPYTEKVINISKYLKVGVFVAEEVAFLTPIDTIFLYLNKNLMENDEKLKQLMEDLPDNTATELNITIENLMKLKTRAKDFVGKVRDNGKKLTPRLISEWKSITTAGLSIAKSFESIYNRLAKSNKAGSNNKINNKNESVVLDLSFFEKADDYFYNDRYELTESGLKLLYELANNGDYDNHPEILEIVCHYCGL